MKFSRFTDYGFRTLIVLGCERERYVSIEEISRAYDVSFNHVGKAVQALVRAGWVESRRGRSGGLRLAVDPEDLTVGEVVRQLEPGLDLLECFRPETDRCVISSVCRLKSTLYRAREAFFAELDSVTLADLTSERPGLPELLGIGAGAVERAAPTRG